MKAKITALAALTALTLSPVFAAPEKPTATTSAKRTTAPSASDGEKDAVSKKKASADKRKSAASKKTATEKKTSARKKAPAEKSVSTEKKISPAQTGARQLVADLTPTQKTKMLTLLNEGTPKELTVIKGVSMTRAEAIEKARPFESIEEVLLVSGVGKKTMSEIVSHARSLTAARKTPSPSASPAKEEKEKS